MLLFARPTLERVPPRRLASADDPSARQYWRPVLSDKRAQRDLDGRKLRYLRILPGRAEPLQSLEYVKGPNGSALIVMAVTLEMP